jgi:hypothetical protein
MGFSDSIINLSCKEIVNDTQNITTGLHGKSEPLQCKQPKKGILLRQVDDAPYEVELGVLYN